MQNQEQQNDGHELTVVHGSKVHPDTNGGIEFQGETEGEWLWSDYSITVTHRSNR